jgi:two-component system cell cycle response regulator DivK
MQKKIIIIFDNDEDILSLCSYILTKLGWEVHTRQGCGGLITTLENIQPSIIFIDNDIQDLGGVIATQTIKSHSTLKTIPVVYFSAHQQIKILAEEAGVDTYLEKPFQIKDLKKVLTSACHLQ